MGCCVRKISKVAENPENLETAVNERKKLTLVRSPGIKLSQKEMILANKGPKIIFMKNKHLVRVSDQELE